MLTLRRSADRGHADHGWLQSFHSFSFADYHDPAHMGVGNLRVLNEDRIAPGTGFGTHGHRDMEILSYVLHGALAHQDSMGNGASGTRPAGKADGVIRPGDVQRMSAGTGVLHSEFNHQADQATHFLQIWIIPSQRGIAPGYEQKHFATEARRGRLALVASPDGAEGSVTIHADARLHAGLFDGAERAEQALDPARIAYVHLARGTLRVNGQALQAGDALRLDGEAALVLEDGAAAEVLVFDLAP
ncbi:MAG: pirin family protein [Betaproteobacteria bacterium]|jgi:redox-sensitive bicupin YhaK (pirin superfamily)|nr:pirin family protein [Rubrivivax sp.]